MLNFYIAFNAAPQPLHHPQLGNDEVQEIPSMDNF